LILIRENSLEECGAKPARKALAEQSGISEKLILAWLNRADLARIKGVSTQYADLFEKAGVDTVPELAQGNTENVQKKMAEVNEESNLVPKVASLSQVKDWVAQAKELPRKISH
jgi:predicted flap endonuclease-1-like 5' DNA nuclease